MQMVVLTGKVSIFTTPPSFPSLRTHDIFIAIHKGTKGGTNGLSLPHLLRKLKEELRWVRDEKVCYHVYGVVK